MCITTFHELVYFHSYKHEMFIVYYCREPFALGYCRYMFPSHIFTTMICIVFSSDALSILGYGDDSVGLMYNVLNQQARIWD